MSYQLSAISYQLGGEYSQKKYGKKPKKKQ